MPLAPSVQQPSGASPSRGNESATAPVCKHGEAPMNGKEMSTAPDIGVSTPKHEGVAPDCQHASKSSLPLAQDGPSHDDISPKTSSSNVDSEDSSSSDEGSGVGPATSASRTSLHESSVENARIGQSVENAPASVGQREGVPLTLPDGSPLKREGASPPKGGEIAETTESTGASTPSVASKTQGGPSQAGIIAAVSLSEDSSSSEECVEPEPPAPDLCAPSIGNETEHSKTKGEQKDRMQCSSQDGDPSGSRGNSKRKRGASKNSKGKRTRTRSCSSDDDTDSSSESSCVWPVASALGFYAPVYPVTTIAAMPHDYMWWGSVGSWCNTGGWPSAYGFGGAAECMTNGSTSACSGVAASSRQGPPQYRNEDFAFVGAQSGRAVNPSSGQRSFQCKAKDYGFASGSNAACATARLATQPCPQCKAEDCVLVGGGRACGAVKASGLRNPSAEDIALQQEAQLECYMTNLVPGHVGKKRLWQHLDWLFSLLPEFQKRYKKLIDEEGHAHAVRRIKFLERGDACFVEFADDVLASTAILMDRFVLHGRPVRVRRPARYRVPGSGLRRPLDTAPLRAKGLLPPAALDPAGVKRRILFQEL